MVTQQLSSSILLMYLEEPSTPNFSSICLCRIITDYTTMGSPEQPPNENTNDGNDASTVLSIILEGVIPGCAVLTVVLIFLVWFMSDCLDPTRPTGEGDDNETPPECPKYSGSPGREQDHASPPYEAASGHPGLATERWGDDRTVCDEGDDSHSQHRGASRHPTTSSLPPSSDTTCLNSKASSIQNVSAA